MSESRAGTGILGWMFLIFLTLKLTGVIDWSWWWVTAPLWVPLCIVVLVISFWFICMIGLAILKSKEEEKYKEPYVFRAYRRDKEK